MYKIFSLPVPIEKIGKWKRLASGFDRVFGYTNLGDLILRNSENGQFALLFTTNPELVPLDFYDVDDFIDGYIKHEKVREYVINEDKVKKIEMIVGALEEEEVYIPEPYLFLGGDGRVESYGKGNIWVYLDIIGEMQGV